MKKIHIILSILFLAISIQAQDKITISGYIYDAMSYSAIPNAHIINRSNKNGCSSDNNGFFQIQIQSFPVEIEISHLSYKKQRLYIKSIDQNWENYFLESCADTLSVFTLSANPIEDLIKEKPLFVYDYIHFEDKLLLLAFRNKQLTERELVLLNNSGEIIHSRSIDKAKELYSDCMGNSYLLTKNTAYQIMLEDQMLYLAYPMSRELFVENQILLEEEFSKHLFLKQFYYRSQGLQYFAYDYTNDSLKIFSNIEKEEMIASMQWGGYFDNSPADKHFEQLIVYKAVYAPLYAIKDSLFLFNYEENKIHIYNDSLHIVKNIEIDFHHDKNWKAEMYYDAIQQKMYTKIQERGKTSIAEIDLSNGNIIRTHQIPDFVFIEKISVRDDYIYFLYKENTAMAYKKLYRTPFDS